MHPFYEPSRRLLQGHDTRREGLLSMVAYLLFWATAVPIAIRALNRSSDRPSPPADQHDPAIAVLRMRLARGEIDVDEFVTRDALLRARDRAAHRKASRWA
jgi:putative membrane protein